MRLIFEFMILINCRVSRIVELLAATVSTVVRYSRTQTDFVISLFQWYLMATLVYSAALQTVYSLMPYFFIGCL